MHILKIVAVAIAIAATIGTPAVTGFDVLGQDEPSGGSCPAVAEPTALADEALAGTIPEVEPVESVEQHDLGTTRDPWPTSTDLSLTHALDRGVEYLNVSVGVFERSDGRALDPAQVVAQARVDQRGRREVIHLSVCIDPVAATASGRLVRADAGAYTGTVSIDDPRVTGGAVTYRINMQYGPWTTVAFVALLSWLVGGVAGVYLASDLELTGIFDKTKLARTVPALILSLGGVFAAFRLQYVQDPSWSGNLASFFALAAACIGAAYVSTNAAGGLGPKTSGNVAAGGGAGPGAVVIPPTPGPLPAPDPNDHD